MADIAAPPLGPSCPWCGCPGSGFCRPEHATLHALRTAWQPGPEEAAAVLPQWPAAVHRWDGETWTAQNPTEVRDG